MDNVGAVMAGTRGSALYLYAVVPARGLDGMPLTLSAKGLDGAAVELIARDGIGVLTHECPPEPYEGDAPAVHAWVLAQHEVIAEAFAKAGTVLPIRFDSIVAATDKPAAQLLEAWLEHSHDALASRLDELMGRVELGVQIISAAPPAKAGRAAPGQSRGRDYFQAQMAERKERERVRAHEDMLAARAFEELSSRAEDVSLNPKRGNRDGAGAEQSARVLLDAAVLVPRERISVIGDYLGEVAADETVKVRFTGPWPPYSFVGSLEMPMLMTSANKPHIDQGAQTND